MLDSEKLALAAHLHVVMRRKIGRVTDVEWMVRSQEYAREIIRVALAEPDQPEMHDWARKLEAALLPPVATARTARTVDARDSRHSEFADSRQASRSGIDAVAPAPTPAPAPAPRTAAARYVGSLR
ncbi:MAG: hypothetical protein CFE46_08990 [Burkholderiales bacterium PBB6]|jgi:hypothetical protein|nr:MAG: hypothetical protein CFE46_08990 [Burkholderiales bacterium PBB6]